MKDQRYKQPRCSLCWVLPGGAQSFVFFFHKLTLKGIINIAVFM